MKAGAARKKARRVKAPVGPIQRMYDRGEVERQQAALAVITPEQKAKGTYDGERRIVNRGGTPVMRWIHAGKLSETQSLAISKCYRLWAICGTEQRTTSKYGERIGSSGSESDHNVRMVIEAREDLLRIQGYIPRQYWDVFQNVCRFDEPAGVAGSKLGSSRGAEDRAHTIVCLVADTIAMHERLIPNVRIG